jgi:hypothetical protein
MAAANGATIRPQRVVLAVMRDPLVGRPQPAHQLHAFFEDALVVGKVHPERRVLAAVVTASRREIDAAVAQEIEARPLLGDADRVVQRQHRDGRRQPDVLGARRDIGEHQVGAGEDAERVEMVLADPGRVHAELVRIERLGGDVGDELVRAPPVVLVVVIAQREVAEFHGFLLRAASKPPDFSCYLQPDRCRFNS